jgi:multiple sugar transport system permease protein
LQLAAAVLMSIPVAVLFFVFQRRIMNTTAGGEKG